MMDQLPIITRQAKIALWTALVLSILDFGLMLGNIGLSSLFLGLCATCMSIIHLSTHLIIVRVREKRALRRSPVTRHNAAYPRNADGADVFPPTSTLPSICVTIFIIVFYVAAFGVSIFALVSHEIYMLVPAVVCLDAAFEVFCAAALVWLVVIGVKERKGYLELTSRIRLEDAPTTSS